MNRPNREPLSLRIPVPAARPGDRPDFSYLDIAPAGAVARPAINVSPDRIRDLPFTMIRVLDEEGRAVGEWNPMLDSQRLLGGLETMILTREFDDRMFRAQRQGKTSFYMKCTGEEAVATAAALALDPEDMCFPSYRQQAILIQRGYPLVKMMCQIFSNSEDPMKGRQLPVMYSSREHGFFSISGNLGTQFPQAVGWAMASAYKHDSRIAASWIGEGSTAEGDFHYALTLASVYRAPVVLNVVNNQWAISTFRGIANGEGVTFAARGIGYGIPSLRVDGNDFLAVFAATAWAAERARLNLGPTLIELVTYRASGHSTSDDPSRYRPADEAQAWPLGDPIKRLVRHLMAIGALDPSALERLEERCRLKVRDAYKEAESHGVLESGDRPNPATMFDDVFAVQPWHLEKQRREAGF